MRIRKKIKDFHQTCWEDIDASSLAAFRILLGMIMTYYVFIMCSSEFIEENYIQPSFFFSFPLFDFLGLKPWGAPIMYAHFLVMGIAMVGITLGLFFRLSLAIAFLTYGYIFLLEKSYYNNHAYLVLILFGLLFFTQAGRCWSLDGLINPKIRTQTIPQWNIWLLRAQIVILYFFSGLAKCSFDWISGAVIRIPLSLKAQYPTIGPFVEQSWFIFLISWGGLLFNLSIGFLLCFRRTRWWAIWLTVSFHLFNQWVWAIGIFHALALATLFLFLDPHHTRRLINRICAFLEVPSPKAPVITPLSSSRPKWPMLLVCVYLIIQILIPLRHYAIPGDVSWTNEGDRFSWRLFNTQMVGVTFFFLTDPATGKTEKIEEYDLSYNQYRVMCYFPDMILQYAHYLRDTYKDAGIKNPVITANSAIALNGREPAVFVDPDVNLANETMPLFGHVKWILEHPDKR